MGATKRASRAGFIFIGYSAIKEELYYTSVYEIARDSKSKQQGGVVLVSSILSGSSVVFISFVA